MLTLLCLRVPAAQIVCFAFCMDYQVFFVLPPYGICLMALCQADWLTVRDRRCLEHANAQWPWPGRPGILRSKPRIRVDGLSSVAFECVRCGSGVGNMWAINPEMFGTVQGQVAREVEPRMWSERWTVKCRGLSMAKAIENLHRCRTIVRYRRTRMQWASFWSATKPHSKYYILRGPSGRWRLLYVSNLWSTRWPFFPFPLRWMYGVCRVDVARITSNIRLLRVTKHCELILKKYAWLHRRAKSSLLFINFSIAIQFGYFAVLYVGKNLRSGINQFRA